MCMCTYCVLIIDQVYGRRLYVFVYVCILCVDHRPGLREETVCVCVHTVC